MEGSDANGVWKFERDFTARNDEVSKRTYVLGVDGGATTTISVVLASRGTGEQPEVVSRAVTGSSNFNSVSRANANIALENCMAAALQQAQVCRRDIRVVCLALSGVNSSQDAERVLAWLRACKRDGGTKFGCVLIAGTGTIAYGFNKVGKIARASGLGPLLGDQEVGNASGHAISTNALAAVLRAYDGRGPRTELTPAILEKLNLSDPEEIIEWVYADTAWARTSALVPVVKACARNGDKVAIGLLEQAVEELASSVKAVVRTLKLGGNDGSDAFPFVMVGGVLEHEEGWDLCKPLIDNVREAFPSVEAIRPTIEPAVGAALVAWRHSLDKTERKV